MFLKRCIECCIQLNNNNEESVVSHEVEKKENFKCAKVKYENGDIYEGITINEERNGFGLYRFSFGDKYEGEYKNDMKTGFGSYYFENGDEYIGEFRDNLKHGLGKYKLKSGKILQGKWVDDKLTMKMDDYIFAYTKEVKYEDSRNLHGGDEFSSSCSSDDDDSEVEHFEEYELKEIERQT